MKKVFLLILSMLFVFALGSPLAIAQTNALPQLNVFEFQKMPVKQAPVVTQSQTTLDQIQAVGVMFLGGLVAYVGLEIINRLPRRRVQKRSSFKREDDEPDTATEDTDPPVPPAPIEQPVPVYGLRFLQNGERFEAAGFIS